MTARADHLMTTAMLLALVVICSSPVLLALVDGTKDTANRFPETGAFIVWVEDSLGARVV